MENQTKKENLTEVTSIAKEEARTGEKINLPSPEELQSKAMASFIKNKQVLPNIFSNLSSKQKNRVMAAIIDLPTDGVPVYLKSDEERYCFALGQRMLSDRFLLTYYHIVEEQRKAKLAEQTETKKETNNE